MHSFFVDFAKAYNNVDRLFSILRNFKIPNKLIRMIMMATGVSYGSRWEER